MRLVLQARCGKAENVREGKGWQVKAARRLQKGEKHMEQATDVKIDYTSRRFVTTQEAMKILQCSRPVASRAIHVTNERLKKQGCFTVTGRCNRQAFFETLGYR